MEYDIQDLLKKWEPLLEHKDLPKYADEKLKEQADLREQVKEKKVLDLMIALSDVKGKK